MKTEYWILILMMTLMAPVVMKGQEITLLSYNIKNDGQKEGKNNWSSRRETMVELLQWYQPQMFGVQEALSNQIEYLDNSLPDYSYVGVGRDDGNKAGEFSAIYYDSTRYRVILDSTFWLSKTPEKVSKGWDAACIRICTIGFFEDRLTKQRLWVMNTHFDHRGVKAREKSARLILKQIDEFDSDKDPLVLMGDFNAEPEDKSICLLKNKLGDAQAKSQTPFYGPSGTFNGFTTDVIMRRIDYFFVKNMVVKSYAHIDDRLDNNLHISDHLPILMKVELK